VRLLTRPSTVAFGLTNLYLLSLSGPLISPDHDLVYHLIGASSALSFPIVIYILALWLLLTVLLTIAGQPRPATDFAPGAPQRPPSRLSIFIWSSFILTLPWRLIHTIGGFADWRTPGWLDLLCGSVVLAAVVLAVVRHRRFGPTFRRLLLPIASVLGFLSLTGVLILGELLYYTYEARDLNPPTILHHATSISQPHARVFWIILDELSYEQVYERRFPGLELPAFDQLAAESTNLTHVAPSGEFTRTIIPTLMTGIPANSIRVNGAGMLLALHDPVDGHWHPFDPHQTVFQDALNLGYTTSIAGWYNPYCRILPDVLDQCYWVYHEATPAGLSPNRTAYSNLFRPLRRLRHRMHYLLYRMHLAGAYPPLPDDDLLDIRMHSSDYRDLLVAGDHQIADPSLQFVFLHLPIPHPYGFYDRRTRSISTVHTSYIDNLALADTYLAHVRQLLESSHEWDSSTVLVMGDHSWRTSFIWSNSNSWTAEDDLASHEADFDDRPAYLVKLPNQHQPARIDAGFDSVRTRALLDALLREQIHSAADLDHWVRLQK